MQYNAVSPEDYVSQLPDDRKKIISELREVIVKNLPEGFEETIQYGMIGYVVPHSIYPGGYHCEPKQPLPFIGLASQKNFVALYHMGIFADTVLQNWFRGEYLKHSKSKPDMCKSCIRFKKPENIPFALIGELVSRMTVQQWIKIYESQIKR
jgi:hypothetical protein